MKPIEFLLVAVLFAVWKLALGGLLYELCSYAFFCLWAVASFRSFVIEQRAADLLGDTHK